MAVDSDLAPFVKFAKTLRDHAAGVLRWFVKGLTNGILEGINSLIQAVQSQGPRIPDHSERSSPWPIVIAGQLRFDGLEPLWGSPLGSAAPSPT